MALPVSFDADLSVGTRNSYHPALKGSDGEFYTVLRGTVAGSGTDNISLQNATDPTDSFAEVATLEIASGVELLSIWCFQKGDTIDVAMQDANRDVYHTTADISGDTLAAETTVESLTTSDDGPNANACSVARESTGTDIVTAYQGDPEMIMGTEYARIVTNRWSGSAWDGPQGVDDGGTEHWTGPVIVLGSSDRMHIFFKNDDLDDGFQRTLRSDDSLETFPSAFDSLVSTNAFYLYGNGISGSTVYIAYKPLNQGAVIDFTSEDTPSLNKTANVADAAVLANNSSAVIGMAIDGSDLHLLYSRNVDSDLYRDINTGSGWGTDTEVLDAVTVNHVSLNVYDRSGTKLAYIYDDGGTVKYNEVDISSGPAPGSGAITVAGDLPSVINQLIVKPSSGAVSVAGAVPTVTSAMAGEIVEPAVGAVTVAGAQPTVTDQEVVAPGDGAIAVAGDVPVLITDQLITPAPGLITVLGTAPVVFEGFTVEPGAGSISILGGSIDLIQAQVSSPVAGLITVLGAAPEVFEGFTVVSSDGDIAVAGYTPILIIDQVAQPIAGAIDIAGAIPVVVTADFVPYPNPRYAMAGGMQSMAGGIG